MTFIQRECCQAGGTLPNRTKRQRSGQHVESLERRRLLSASSAVTNTPQRPPTEPGSEHFTDPITQNYTIPNDPHLRSILIERIGAGATVTIPVGIPLRQLTVKVVDTGAGINIQEEGAALAVKIESAAMGVTLFSNSSIYKLDCQAWTGGTITAPSIWRLRADDFSADLNLATQRGVPFDRAVVLKSAVLGIVNGGQWIVQGDIGEVHIVSAQDPWGVRLQDDDPQLNFSPNPLAKGEIYRLVDLNNISPKTLPDATSEYSTLEAPVFGSIEIRGQMEAHLIADSAYQNGGQAIASLHVGLLEQSIVYTHANVGSIAVHSITNSEIYCGVPASNPLTTSVPQLPKSPPPTTFSGFDEPATLGRFTCPNLPNPSFAESQVCAFEIDNANLGSVDTSLADQPSLVSCYQLKNLVCQAGERLRFHKPKLAETTTIGSFSLHFVD